ncbi:uncharacterized protein LOC144307364 isoform X1 [Canis aureus]
MILITQPDKQARPAKVLSGLKEIEFWRLKRDILLITDSLGAVQNSILLSRCANLLIHAPTEGHLDYLHILAIMNKPSITMCVQNFVETPLQLKKLAYASRGKLECQIYFSTSPFSKGFWTSKFGASWHLQIQNFVSVAL